ncbi:hypothetical protein K490DRAFT_57209 [Saccharata proteae CBS 121410]|uniref:Uncharacterized protein n=1 Tax=Saccharata proteae CBS 121410 TaxID=1314787 RepID=A0A9P4HW51_9PEZI|nr:hypothetical protein K490DRAFT_57209 [Saccharata proteae CBS 121410]
MDPRPPNRPPPPPAHFAATMQLAFRGRPANEERTDDARLVPLGRETVSAKDKHRLHENEVSVAKDEEQAGSALSPVAEEPEEQSGDSIDLAAEEPADDDDNPDDYEDCDSDEEEDGSIVGEDGDPEDKTDAAVSTPADDNGPRVRPCAHFLLPTTHHRLTCGHVVSTAPNRTFCGQNCQPWSVKGRNLAYSAFLCPVCKAAQIHRAYRNDIIELSAQYPEWGPEEVAYRHMGIWASKMRRWEARKWAGLRVCAQVEKGARLRLKRGETKPPYGVERYSIEKVKPVWMREARKRFQEIRRAQEQLEGMEAEPGVIYESIERDP